MCSVGALVPHQDNGLFEMRADISSTGAHAPKGNLSIEGKDDKNHRHPALFLNFYEDLMEVEIVKLRARQALTATFGPKLEERPKRMSVRMFVNSVSGTIDIMVNGALKARFGQKQNEPAPGIDYKAGFWTIPDEGHPVIVSNLWIGPWNGELPQAETAPRASTAFANGDFTPSAPSAFVDGKYLLDTDAGPLKAPAASVSAIEFGGAYAPPAAAARLRLVDGSMVHVSRFECHDRAISAQSETLGEIHVPLESIAEIVVDPPPLREPIAPSGNAGPEQPRESR
jgi:hypothetical protein